MNLFESEHTSITRRRAHYQRERSVCVAKGSGISMTQIRAKLKANPPSRRQIDITLYGRED